MGGLSKSGRTIPLVDALLESFLVLETQHLQRPKDNSLHIVTELVVIGYVEELLDAVLSDPEGDDFKCRCSYEPTKLPGHQSESLTCL